MQAAASGSDAASSGQPPAQTDADAAMPGNWRYAVRRLMAHHRLQVWFLVLTNVCLVTVFILYGLADADADHQHQWPPRAPFAERQARWQPRLYEFAHHCAAKLRKSHRPGPAPKPRPANILFVKTHKTGSSTVANILLRFAIGADWRVCLPVLDDAHMGWPRPPTPRDVFVPGRAAHCHLMASHAVYRKDSVLPRFFPPGQRLLKVAFVRDPLLHLKSALYYLAEVDQLRLPVADRVEAFLADPAKYNAALRFSGGARVRLGSGFQALELGYTPQQFPGPEDFLAFVDHEFEMVGVTENHTESLVLLRRLAGLPFSALTFAHLNRNIGVTLDRQDALRRRHRAINPLDYRLYAAAQARLAAAVRREGADFRLEVACVGRLNRLVRAFCTHAASHDLLEVPATPWAAGFVFDVAECLSLLALPRELNVRVRQAQFAAGDSLAYFLRRLLLRVTRW